MRNGLKLKIAIALALASGSVVRAANETTPMMQYVGYTALFQQYGGSLADGSNVSVAQDEANGYLSTADGRFSDKTLTMTYTGTTSGDSHATTVGARFFGNDTGYSQRSVAPHLGATSGSSSVQMYKYNEFIGAYLLLPGSAAPYGSQNNARVASHAFNLSDYSINTITRMDYLAQRDDFLQVVPNNQYGSLGDTMNNIPVVSSDGTTTKSDAIGTGTPYTVGRVNPVITGPVNGSPSDAIGQVAGIVGLLMSRGKTTASNYSYTTASTTAVTAPYTGSNFTTYAKSGYTVHSGDTAEVVKAAMMAGALRTAPGNSTLSINGITDYRVAAANQSPNGLDYRWGAGMINAYNSYQIINAGEKDSIEDGGTTIGQQGFDYDPHFGGASGSNTTGTYLYTPGSNGKFAVTLAWNVKIAGGTSSYDSTATLYNLNLKLVDVTAGNTIVASSNSTVDNTQNIFADLTGGHTYDIVVGTTSPSFDWDYGLAWQQTPEPASATAAAAMGLVVIRRRRRK